MLPRIKTKTNLIAPCLKKCVNETTFRQCLHIWMAVYFEETFCRIQRYVILYVFNIVSILFSFKSNEKRQKWHFSEHPIGDI